MILSNIIPLRLIRISLDMKQVEIAKYFSVSGAYFGMVEKGKRNLDNDKLRNGLEKLGISLYDYVDLFLFCERVSDLDISDYDKYKYALIKTIGVVNTMLRDESEQILVKNFDKYELLRSGK